MQQIKSGCFEGCRLDSTNPEMTSIVVAWSSERLGSLRFPTVAPNDSATEAITGESVDTNTSENNSDLSAVWIAYEMAGLFMIGKMFLSGILLLPARAGITAMQFIYETSSTRNGVPIFASAENRFPNSCSRYLGEQPSPGRIARTFSVVSNSPALTSLTI